MVRPRMAELTGTALSGRFRRSGKALRGGTLLAVLHNTVLRFSKPKGKFGYSHCAEYQPMQSQARRLVSLFHTIILVAGTLPMILAAHPAAAQNSVPATAVQAAKMSQYAGRLARPASQSASSPKSAVARQGPRRGPGQGSVIYENGPTTALPMLGRSTSGLPSATASRSAVASCRLALTDSPLAPGCFPGMCCSPLRFPSRRSRLAARLILMGR
jgi:hypothetical protein